MAPSRDYFLSLFTHVGLQPEVRYHSPSFETVRGLVAKGPGVSVLVTRPKGDRSYDGDALVCRSLKESVPPARISLAKIPQSHPTRLLEAFSHYCQTHFRRRARE